MIKKKAFLVSAFFFEKIEKIEKKCPFLTF